MIVKNTTNTSPPVYTLPETDEGQFYVSSTHRLPYQKPREYDASITKNIPPIPAPEYIAYLHVPSAAL